MRESLELAETPVQSCIHRGKVAVVTGSASGIGRAIALLFHAEGAHVVFADLADSSAAMDGAQMEVGAGRAMSVQLDASSEASWDDLRAEVEAAFGTPDILINNVGLCPFVPFLDQDYIGWRSTMQINVDTAFLGARTLVPGMVAKGWGRIINLASASIATEQFGLSAYLASKSAVVGLTRGLANDLGRHGITANAIAPSITTTPATQVVPEDMKRQVYSRAPIPREADPGEIASAVSFLASDRAAFVTGQTLMISGGLTKL